MGEIAHLKILIHGSKRPSINNRKIQHTLVTASNKITTYKTNIKNTVKRGK